MTATQLPNNPDDWARFLLAQSLPSPFRVNQLVLKDLSADRLSYEAIAQHMSRDPVLAWKIMQQANAQRPKANAASKTLAHAISMIGLDGLRSELSQLPLEKVSHKSMESVFYMRALATSFLAAYLARAVCQRRHINPDEVFWSSLFFGLPNWLMWRFASAEMRLARHLFWTGFKRPQDAETQVFGCTLPAIAQALNQHLAMPDLVLLCYRPDYAPTAREYITLARATLSDRTPQKIADRALNLKLHHPAFVVLLCNLLAEAASHDWYSRATLRYQRMLATLLEEPLGEAVALTHIIAAKVSRRHPLPAVMLPAARLLLPARQRSKTDLITTATTPQERSRQDANTTQTGARPSEAQMPQSSMQPMQTDPIQSTTIGAALAHSSDASAAPKPGTEAPAMSIPPNPITETIHPLVREIAEAMLHRPQEFNDLAAVMNAANEFLRRGIGLQRAAIMLINKDQSRLKTYFSSGCENSAELANFDAPLIKQTIFGKLCEHAASVWIKRQSSSKLMNMIPMNFKQIVQVDEFLLMSIFIGKRPIAIIYADLGMNTPLNEQHYEQFKYLCGAVSSALRYQSAKAAS